MLARQHLRRRINDALAAASPLALADAVDAHISARSTAEVRDLIARSAKRMDEAEREQLDLYVNPAENDELMGHRFTAFLRQNPRAIVALDPDAIDAILSDIGEVPAVERTKRRLPANLTAVLAMLVVVAVVPLFAQYAHQSGLLRDINQATVSAPAPIVPFVQAVAMHAVHAAHPAQRGHARPPARAHRAAQPRVHRNNTHAAAVHRPAVRAHRAIAQRPRARRVRKIAWKFDRGNNPYFNRARWKHPFAVDRSLFGTRARLSVRAYLHEVVAGNLNAALSHLGLPAGSNKSAIAELPIVKRGTMVAILGSRPQRDGTEQVQADIVTGGREYYEIFSVGHDGPAVRIVDHYYIPVNRRAQVATRTE